MNKPQRIYLAGPGVFAKDPVKHGEELKQVCREYGFDGVFPLDASLDLDGLSKHEAARAIYEANIALIRSCDGVLVDMQPFRGPGMDGGSAFEMGFAKALGLPVIGYGLETVYHERCKRLFPELEKTTQGEFDPQGFLIEDFDLADNLMMACSADQVSKTLQEALSAFRLLFGLD